MNMRDQASRFLLINPLGFASLQDLLSQAILKIAE
jgi:hypothetical protein